MTTQRSLDRMEGEIGAVLAGAVRRGARAVEALADEVLAAVRPADSLPDVGARLARLQTSTQVRGDLLTALLASMETADLVGRAQVVREASAAGATIAPVEHAFPGQAAVPYRFAELGELDVEPLPPTEALEYFRNKLPMTKTAFEELSDIYRGRAFTIARQQSQKAVKVVQDWLAQCIEEGLTLKDFKDGLAEAAEAGGIRAVNPYHAETVFQTNVQTAYNAGRWEMYHAPEVVEAFPYFQYHTVGDDRVRPSHAQMDGYIARRDDPVWDTWWPPNGFNCRCTVTAISAIEAQERGIRPSRRQVPVVDDGFAGNAALAIRTTGV